MGEGELDFKFLPAGGQFHLRGSDEALTPYGGLVAWDHFLEHCGVITELAANHPLPRTSNNATPVAYILKQAYQRLDQWLSGTAPQLNPTMANSPPWLLFDALHIIFPTADSRFKG